uniref:Uncharacterized protein n=1 Tax=Panagrolaimus davidi TaxID=227884 RepID=A0A914QRL1_9BILA
MDNSIRIINICDNRENSKRLSDSSCKERIKISINENRTFSDVETEFAFTNPKDIKVLLSYYTEIFLKALPFKTKVLIDKLFNNFKEDVFVEWVNVVYNPRSTNEDLEELLKVAPFYECFTNLRDKNNDVDYTKFYATLRNEFSTTFINFSNIKGILQIFQFLLRCKSLPSPNQSTLFCDTVKKFIQDKCAGSDVNLEAETEAKIYDEHFRLAELIENFVDTPYKSVYDLIKNIFPSTTVIPSVDGNKAYVKIKGYRVIWSNIFNKNPLIFDNCDVVEVKAENELIIDDNINLPGITLTLSSLNCVFMKPIIINLSGKNDNTIMPKAQNGVNPGEKGEDGKNGKAGQSSGNFVLVSKNIQKMENLKLVLCGGKGMQGQDGGDGADGADGVGVKFEDQFGTAHKLRTGAKQTVNALTVGIMSRVFDKMIEKRKDDGTFKCFNDSPVYFSTHSFSFVRGADGRPGGKGGKNGIGGQGGKKGKYKIIDRKTENENIAVTAEDGDKGNDGFPGKNADPGKDGWDIAVLNRTFGRRIEFGKEHNEKLFFKLEDNESENSVYIKDKNCFAKIIKQPCTKERLKETEQFTEFNTNSEMNGESIAVAAVGIDISALMEDRHTAVTNEINEEQQEIKSGLDEEINVERVMELWIDDKEEPYTPKERHKTPLFPEDCFEG